MAGLDSTGFVIKTLPEIVSSIEASELALISTSLDVQPTAIIGVLNGIYAQAIYELWQLAGALYNGMDPDQATGDQLESLALITGTDRSPATATVCVDCTVDVDAGFNALAGTMFASVVGSPDVQFYNLTEVDSPGGGTETVSFICAITGPIQALDSTLTVISQPLSGWNSITNPDDGLVGSNIENDASLRLKRVSELATSGSATAAAIRADVLQNMQTPTTTVDTSGCTVLYNDTEVTDANGVPPHSIEVIARAEGASSGDDELLCALILNAKSAGDGTYSGDGTYKVVTDSQGNEETIYYTRPTDTVLTIVIQVVVDPQTWPGDTAGKAAIKAAMVTYAAATYEPGVTVYAKRLADQAFTQIGVVDWNTITVNGGGNLAIDIRSVATLSSGDITVNVA